MTINHDPPSRLWFHFHPSPSDPGPTDDAPDVPADPTDDAPDVPADHGELWEQPYYSHDEALKQLQKPGANGMESAEEAGWIVVGPFVHAPLMVQCEYCGLSLAISTEKFKGPVNELACPRLACHERRKGKLVPSSDMEKAIKRAFRRG